MTTKKRKIWYQKQEMLAIARTCGFTVSEGLFDDWVEKGLLGEAGERVRPGRGSIARWPQEQLQLFLNLLVLRRRSHENIRLGQLCHIPVWRWLYWGELGGVPLQQVRRAISTWIDFQQKLPEEHVRRDITQTMRRYQGPKATDKRALIDELTEIWVYGKTPERDVLQVLLDPVVNAYPKKAKKGPVREYMDLAECWSLMHSLCFKVLQDKRMLLDFPDAFWSWARFFNVITHGFNLHERPLLANDPVLGSLFLRQTVHSLCPQSCHALLTWLGLAQQREIAPWHAEPLRFLDPWAWQSGEVAWTMQTQILSSPLVLPGGKPIPYLCNTFTISYQEIQQPFSVALPFL